VKLVLDDHLETAVAAALRRRYPNVNYLRDLRPGTLIKDDSVARLLLTEKRCVFLTINVTHFWQKVDGHPGYCILCFALPSGDRVAELLSRVIALPGFRTQVERAGKVARVTMNRVTFYTRRSGVFTELPLP